ncbi:MAG: aspartate aminotransferase family protein [Dehalococcoidia bacterium]|nr:MAG: aspartate aminotransferase family protein [Dehalococcoidia bacterium]
MTNILGSYSSLHPRSVQLYQQALQMFPSGVTHDVRFLPPFPLYIERAQGCRKWDVDGNEIVDYVMGHGALMLGHSHPLLVQAVNSQIAKGTHYGACHELELTWANWVQRLMPSAEKVRFTNSGTEATLMAIRLARAYTGRDKILKFDYHFHGWHDNVMGARYAESDVPRVSGVPMGTLENQVTIPQNDVALVERTLAENRDIAAVIIEPSGGSWGTLPLVEGFLAQLGEATERHGVLLIFDEVVTGFRLSPGGAQELYGVQPDLTCLAKILAGGLPGGAVATKRDIFALMEFTLDMEWNLCRRVFHPGTFNANPLSAAAGTAMLSHIADGRPQAHADAMTQRLVPAMNKALEGRGIPGCVYGLSSMFHIVLGEDCPRPRDGVEWPWDAANGASPPRTKLDIALALKRGCLNNGVDLMGFSGGLVSAVHQPADIDFTVEAFDRTLGQMQEEGIL